jgi:zinc and cadmium transporter
VSFAGIATLVFSERTLNRLLLAIVGFAAGALIGGAFLHLIPEAVSESADVDSVFALVIVGFIIFFILEKALWRHCHNRACPIHTFAYLNLVGDAVHNFIDGMIIAASYLIAVPLGISTTLAVAVHEIPQEIGDFGVLVYGGLKPRRALVLNFLTAITAVVGGLIGFWIRTVSWVALALLPIAAGGFLYIAASDLVPEIYKEANMKRSALAFASFVLGVILMWAVRYLTGG